ncbi:MAG: ABC transporter permease, partial [Sphaerochaetaceae bacterium]|nr:ABC transporter permease [Sphaerochaetaceae bacterium]
KAKIAPFVMTLCTDFILRGLIMVYTKGQPKGTLAEAFRNVGTERVFGSISVSVFVWLFCSCLFIFILYKTVFGKHVRMVGANMECARFSGVNNDRVLISVYTIAGFLAALAAIILTTEMSATSLNLGADYSMDSISAVVIGGTMFSGGIGGVEGTIAGTLVIRLITSLLQKANVVNWGKLIIQSVLILGVVASNSRRKK